MILNEGLCLEILVPFTLDILEENIFSQGDSGPGDMLELLMDIEDTFWLKNVEEKHRLITIVEKQLNFLNTILTKLT